MPPPAELLISDTVERRRDRRPETAESCGTATRSYWRWPAHTRWKEDGRCVRTFRRCIERHDLHAVRLVCRAGRPESRPISRAWIRRRVPVHARPPPVPSAPLGPPLAQPPPSPPEPPTRTL